MLWIGTLGRYRLFSRAYAYPKECCDLRTVLYAPGAGRLSVCLKILSPRERDVGYLLSCGLLDKEIADKLGIAARTVRHRVTGLFIELEVRNRVELTRYLLKHPEALDGDAVPPGLRMEL